jgi:dCTP deaminase
MRSVRKNLPSAPAGAVLSHPDLVKCVETGEIRFSPQIAASKIKQVSIDLTLGPSFSTFKVQTYVAAIRLDDKAIFDADLWDQHPGDSYILKPQGFVLSETLERITMGNSLMGFVEGRSSWARLGIGVHLTAPKIDPGFENTIKLEISNHGNMAVELAAGRDSPCQLILLRLSTPLASHEVYGTSEDDTFQGSHHTKKQARR